ncbi:hypothetical protein NHQ30_007276 [Ciborinia camelliae]|nr:hypothetical protein NHQ30_007276 [Ciborinia camelliae]
MRDDHPLHWGYLLTSPSPPATTTPFLAPVIGTVYPIIQPALRERLGVLGLEAQLKSLESISSKSGESGETGESGDVGESGEIGEPAGLGISSNPEVDIREGGDKDLEITCRTWIKSTLHTLDEEGYISFPETIGPKIVVDSIEAEAVEGAGWNKMRGTIGWERSVWVGE